ncbi:hypothetical protein HYH96_17105 [Clostridium botulinum]|uniref:Uncharacterized protein n=2 Tax=Clostridium botulinum TaxID=1491 RepID=B1INW3_CLOBK|nr:hypothetical protein [Clostridium botulinum]EKX78815.1 hypothetical protein CFSAN001628_016904 [Clostridium botulinum CFSAN001628]ACA46925.1 hypothetical protein CLD_A0136 [Clostridium botulinum B1 str. Okra]MBD5564685.1 hypothetical protein [Clostridium botulinum]MBD5568532.1 hypothetical protein [Clostridium botulinum]MBD5572263.1 hypothetical protein [Clostridium botulinum]
MINKEDIIKELIEMGVEVDSKIIEKKLKEIYVNEGFALTKEISFMQKYNFRFLLIPLLFDLLLLFILILNGKSFFNTMIIAIILGAIIIIDELINKLKIKSLKSKIEEINIQMNK